MRRKPFLLIPLLLSLLLLNLFFISCSSTDPSPDPQEKATPPGTEPLDPENPEDPEEPPEEDLSEAGPLSPGDLAAYRPNELGEVMILMYHNIGEEESEWTRTPENFRRDLEELYRRGYRTVSLLDYVRGEIDLPAGTSPVILTFDDSTRNQFNYLEADGGVELDPDSAVGILEDFYSRHPDFGRAATFYIFYPQPFRQQPYIRKKLEFLREKGYEIGNHTYGHANLARVDHEEVQRQIALHAQKTGEILPGYGVRSLALPYGSYPRETSLALEGQYQGYRYENEAVLLVGYRPAPSPFAGNFNPSRLPRVRASEMKVDGVGMYDWLEYFETRPDRRYISSGNPHIITVPESYRDKVNPEAVGDREIHFYTLDE